MTIRFLRLVPALAILSLLAGCGEPSEQDIKDALTKQTSAAGKLFGGIANNLMPSIKSVEKLGCKSDGDAYLCDVKVKIDGPLATFSGQPTTIKLVKSSDGWEVMGR